MKSAFKILTVMLLATVVSPNVFANEDKDIKGVAPRVTALEEQVADLEASDSATKSRLDDLESSDSTTKSRLENLEDLGEFLLTSPAIGSADCTLPLEIDTGFGFPGFGFGRDATPPTVTGIITGELTEMLSTFGCVPGDFPPAGNTTDIVSVPRGVCAFETKAANAAAAGYGALIVINGGNSFTYEGQLTVRMATAGGNPLALPSVMINAKDGLDIENFFFTNGPRPMTIYGPAPFCSPVNE